VARPLPSHRKPAKHESVLRENVRENAREKVREKVREKARGRAHEESREPAPVAPELPELDRLIHERIRLGIVSALATNDSLSFNDLKRVLKTTDGNLSVHARKLEEAQYISCVKFFEGRVPRTEYRLTATGRRALSEYLDQMEEWIRVTREDR
jgi:DNA-binding HxlR family transcriptional regulator